MHKPGGANAGTGSCVNKSCCIQGYNAAEARLLLTVERNTLKSGKNMMVAGGTLGSSTAPALGAVALGGRVGLVMVHEFWIAVLQPATLMVVIGMVLRNVRRTLDAARTVRSVVEIVGNGLGTVAMCLLRNSNGWLACRNADTNSAWGQGQSKMHQHQFRVAPTWHGQQCHCRRSF
jgi:hypothetical protein